MSERTVEDALAHAEEWRVEIEKPGYTETIFASMAGSLAEDVVLLAGEVIRLRKPLGMCVKDDGPGVMRVGSDDEPDSVKVYCAQHGEKVVDEMDAVLIATCPHCACRIGVQP